MPLAKRPDSRDEDHAGRCTVVGVLRRVGVAREEGSQRRHVPPNDRVHVGDVAVGRAELVGVLVALWRQQRHQVLVAEVLDRIGRVADLAGAHVPSDRAPHDALQELLPIEVAQLVEVVLALVGALLRVHTHPDHLQLRRRQVALVRDVGAAAMVRPTVLVSRWRAPGVLGVGLQRGAGAGAAWRGNDAVRRGRGRGACACTCACAC
eukprot:3309546-Prymnesium_polylepis.1